MTAGFPTTLADFNSRAGQLATAVRADLYNCSQFCALLQSSPWGSTGLQAIGFTSTDATTMLNAFNDLGGTGVSLYTVAHGGALPSGPNNFFFNANLLTGVVGIG
jgi:hypothetical protein